MSKVNFNDFRKFAMNTKVNGQYANGMVVDDYFKYLDNNQKKFNTPMDYQDISIIDDNFHNAAILNVFSKMVQSNILFLDEIDSETAPIIAAQLLYLSHQNDENLISIYINSPGGEIYAGRTIDSVLNYIPNPIATVGLGLVASYAGIILLQGNYGKRYLHPNSTVMLHQPLSGCSGPVADMEISFNEANRLKKELFQLIADRTGHNYDEVESMCTRDKWMTAQEAVDWHIADKILQPQPKKIITYNEYLAQKESED